MGAALLLEWAPRPGPDAPVFDRIAACFPRRVREMSRSDESGGSARVGVWSHSHSPSRGLARDEGTASFLAVIGNPSGHGLTSADGDALPAELLKRCLVDVGSTFDAMSPPYAAVFYDGRDGTAHVLVDRLGFQHVYLRQGDDGSAWISSSGLALAAGLPSTVDPHHVAEWLAMGHFMSDRTLVREVRKLGAGEHVQLTKHGVATLRRWQPRLSQPDLDMGETLVDRFGDEFRRAVAISAVEPGLASEMTGGIDSRYLLAALLDNGASPLAWTMGQPGWSELKIIERLRERRPFDHRVVSLDARIVPRLPELVQEMQQLSDGEANALE